MRSQVRFLLGHELRRARPGRPDHDGARLAPARASGGPAPRKAATRATAAPAPSCSARPEAGRLDYRAVNACIQFVATLDGCQLLTVEDLKGADGSLHPVQQAMVDCHGSQCGFCTPGFVMSMFALTRNAETAARTRRRSTTRWRAISAAAPATRRSCARCSRPIAAGPRQRRDRGLGGRHAGAGCRRCRTTTTLVVGDGERRFIAPATVDALAEVLLAEPEATIVAGNTDVGLWVTKQMRVLDPVVYLGRVRELQRIEETAEAIVIGAGVSHGDAMTVAGPLLSGHGRDVAPVRVGCRSATPAPWAATSPTARRSATPRRADRRRCHPACCAAATSAAACRSRTSSSPTASRTAAPGEFVERITRAQAARRLALPRLQDQQALRPGHLGGDGGIPAAARRRARASRRGSPSAAWRPRPSGRPMPRRRSSAGPGPRPRSRPAMAALAQRFPADSATCAPRPATGSQVARNLLRRLHVETTGTAETRLVGERSLAHV